MVTCTCGHPTNQHFDRHGCLRTDEDGLLCQCTHLDPATNTAQVIVRMPVELHEAFRLRAEAEERSVAAAIRHACRQYLDS